MGRTRKPAKPPLSPPALPSLPAWFRPLLLVISGALLLGLFSKEISDTDFWWHLKSGEYIWQTHSLPDPDPFAYTTASAGSAYPGEETTRHFNLTHEWLSQLLLYLIYRAAGFGGVVLGRAALLAGFCVVAGLIAYRRVGGFYRPIAVALATAAVASAFGADRPYLVSFLFVAILVAILDSGQERLLWFWPPLMLVWANSHGGFILGWAVLAAALLAKPRRPVRSWALCVAAALIAGLNPNGFRVIPVLLNYRHSFLTSTLAEWRPAVLWPPSAFAILLLAGATVLIYARRRVRMLDWLLCAAFAAAGLLAGRNTFLIGFLSPVLIATYLPPIKISSRSLELAAAALLFGALAFVGAGRRGFQLRVAGWAFPMGAVEFMRSHGVTQRIFNTYEYGGYLIWRLWPRERVFIDGRALSESVFADYGRILHKADVSLLDRYGVEVIVMNTFEYTSGVAYTLAPALAESEDQQWKLVYADATAVIFMRHPPPDMRILASSQVFEAMQAECDLHIEHEPQYPACARALGLMFDNAGEPANARRWLGKYLEHVQGSDPEAESAYRKLFP